MDENEVIILDGVPPAEYDVLLKACVNYALLSLPFTMNRMDIESIRQRVLNITKGKIAEALFWYFCKHNLIRPDFKSCATEFWEPDKGDFLLDGYEWDIKNNYIYHSGNIYHNYTLLPALIPNRFDGDQWSKRFQKTTGKAKGVRYLFTFIRNAGLTKFREREQEFLELHITHDQEQFLHALYTQYKGKPQRSIPFTKDWFWVQMEQRGPLKFFTLHNRPALVITGYADSNTFSKFKDTGPGAPFNYQEYILPVWYTRSATRKSSNFLNNTLWTTIRNATCPVAELPSFLETCPDLKQEIKLATLKCSSITK